MFLCFSPLSLKLYKSELENEFSQFMDWLHIFPLYKGKSNFDDEDEDDSDRAMGKYKVNDLLNDQLVTFCLV